MNEQEIRAKYESLECKTQIEFDRAMSELNDEQTRLNHPYLDRDRELALKRTELRQKALSIKAEMEAITAERIGLEQKRKSINRVFHELKHGLIERHPKEKMKRIEN